MKYVLKLQEDKPTEETEKRIIEYCELLKWEHVVKYLQRGLPSKYPPAFRPF